MPRLAKAGVPCQRPGRALEPAITHAGRGRLWYGEPNAISNAIGYAKFRSRSRRAVIRAYDDAGNLIETHEQLGRRNRRHVGYCGHA